MKDMKANRDPKVNVPREHFHLQWHITERCNLRCKHCYMDDELIRDEMDFYGIKDVLYQYFEMVKEWGIGRAKNRISFTGGEPFARRDVFDILEECRKNWELSRYGLLCNGYFLSDENVARLKALRVDYVQVSIEGKQETNDSIRGKGAFVKAVEGLKRVVSAGMGTSISMTVHKKNLKEIPDMIELARKLGVKTLGVRRLVPYGQGKALADFLLSPQQTKHLFEYAEQASRQAGELNLMVGCEDGIAAQDMHYFPRGCLCGYHSLTLLPNGYVYPCRRLPVLVGDLRKETLNHVFKKSRVLDKVRDINNINDECLACQFFNECLGGAKCISYAYWGKLGGADPQCWKRFDALPSHDLDWKVSQNKRKKITYF